MNAAVLEDIGRLVVKDVVRPEVRPGSLLIEVKACGICGSDLAVFHRGDPSIILPQIIGHEFVGVVVAVGDGVTGFRPGDRVTSATSLGCGGCSLCAHGFTNMCDNITAISAAYPGAFAEYMEIPEKAVMGGYALKIPEKLSDESAALSELLACIMNSQDRANVGRGDTVVVIGAGPVGCLICEAAKSRGAKKVVMVEKLDARLDMARKFSADAFVNSDKENPTERVIEETDGCGADVVIVAAPSPDAMEQSLEMAKKRGRVNFFAGLPSDSQKVPFDARLIHYRELSVTGTCGSTAHHHKAALDLLAAGGINTRDLITHELPLKDIVKGFEIAESRLALKVIIRPDWN